MEKEVRFENQYKMKVAGNLVIPKRREEGRKLPAIIVGHPMGAVKEQSATLYARKMAEFGFITLAIDLSFWGGSEGEPRNAVSPDLYAESFSAAADYLRTLPFVEKEKIGVIGICGSGSFAISAAKIDPRLKAIATVSMYDMGQANRNALHKSLTLEQREKSVIAEAALQRDAEFSGGPIKYTGGTVHKLTEKSTPVEIEFFEFYRTSRGEFTPPGASPSDHHPSDSDQQCQIHELLSVRGSGDDLAAAVVVHHRNRSSFAGVQRERIQTSVGTEGTLSCPPMPDMWICMTGSD